MSVVRPAPRLLSRCFALSRPQFAHQEPRPLRRSGLFHSSAPRCKRRSRYREAEEMGLLDPVKMAEVKEKHFPDYTSEEWAMLESSYSPQQMEAIRLGEEAVDPKDLIIQGRVRDDKDAPNYVEDFAEMDPRHDIKPEMDITTKEPQWLPPTEWADNFGLKMMKMTNKSSSDQLTRAMIRAIRRVKESKGEDLIDLTDAELEDMEKDPELLQKYLVSDDDGEPSGEEYGLGEKAGLERDSSGAQPYLSTEAQAEMLEGQGNDAQPGSSKEAQAEMLNNQASDSLPDLLTMAQVEMLDKAIDEEWEKELEQIAKGSGEEEFGPSNLQLLEDGPTGLNRMYSAKQHDLGKVPGVAGLYKSAKDPEDEGQDDAGNYREIKRLTGMRLRDIQSIYRKVLVHRFVANQTRLGKVRSSSVVAIAGNGNGRLGLGIAKSTDRALAAETAMLLAIRNMKPIRRYENRTIYGKIKAKVSGTIVELFARPPGFGLRCPHRIFEMCRASGLHDIAARMPRSKNPMNSVKAAYQALRNQIDPEQIALGRGKKLVDVRKVYYGGAVY